MNNSAAARPVRSLIVAVTVAAAVLGAACSNPVGPREPVAAPRASVHAVAAKEASTASAKTDSAAVTPVPQDGAYSGGGVLPWY